MGLPDPVYADDWATLYHGDALALLPEIPSASVNLILVDPPYMNTKLHYQGQRVEWDRQWRTRADYLAWLRQMAREWQRLLTPNGSLYCFAAPQMAAHVEVMLEEMFTILNRIRWVKEAGWHQKTVKEELRAYLSPWEEILFAEPRGADSMTLGESGYAATCERLHGFVFERLRAYLAAERDRAGWTTRRVAEAFQQKTGSRTVTGMAGHWFETVQWELPTRENYQWLRALLNADGHEYLRREYEDLRREYEDLRRPFTLTPDVPYTDTWEFATVPAGPGKHPCAKPLAMLRHMIQVSSRPGATVLDCCAGGGSTLVAAKALGRKSIGIELEAASCRLATDALRQDWLPWE